MAKSKAQNPRIQKLIKAVKLLNAGQTIEEVAKDVKLSIEDVTTLRSSMIVNLREIKDILDTNIGDGAADAIYEDNLLYIEEIAA